MWIRLLLAGVLVTASAPAQRGGGGGRGGGTGEMGEGMGMTMPRPQTRADQLADKLKLNKDQKQQVQEILSAGSEEAAPLRGHLMQARVQLAGALIENKGEQEVQKAQDAVAAAVAQVTGVEAKSFARIYALLKPSQQAKAPQAFELMAGIFTQGRGNSGGAMGRREGR